MTAVEMGPDSGSTSDEPQLWRYVELDGKTVEQLRRLLFPPQQDKTKK